MWDSIKEFFIGFWESLVDLFQSYQEFIYGIFPSPMGDLVSFIILAVVAILIIKSISFSAFKK